ncbi:MAG TPA: hypothetical protein VJA26_03655, partial [Gammaproteobacteria bacterium]|nr:hypothetical protein [Gammaproteobacteria bacterium]
VDIANDGEGLLLVPEPATRELEHLPEVLDGDSRTAPKSTRRTMGDDATPRRNEGHKRRKNDEPDTELVGRKDENEQA